MLPITSDIRSGLIFFRRGFGNTLPLGTWSSLAVTEGNTDLRTRAIPSRHGAAVVSVAVPEVSRKPSGGSGASGDAPPPDVHRRAYS
jgi:hypothetical protein